MPASDLEMNFGMTQEMQKFTKALDELFQERNELKDELKMLRDKILNQSDDENDETPAYTELREEYELILS